MVWHPPRGRPLQLQLVQGRRRRGAREGARPRPFCGRPLAEDDHRCHPVQVVFREGASCPGLRLRQQGNCRSLDLGESGCHSAEGDALDVHSRQIGGRRPVLYFDMRRQRRQGHTFSPCAATVSLGACPERAPASIAMRPSNCFTISRMRSLATTTGTRSRMFRVDFEIRRHHWNQARR